MHISPFTSVFFVIFAITPVRHFLFEIKHFIWGGGAFSSEDDESVFRTWLFPLSDKFCSTEYKNTNILLKRKEILRLDVCPKADRKQNIIGLKHNFHLKYYLLSSNHA